MPKYYDDQKRLIANDTNELVLYFQSLNGNEAAYQVPITLPCPATAIIQVKSTGVVPKFIYINQPTPNNKITPKLLPADTLDLSPLCNGVDLSNILPAPDCGTPTFTAFVFPAPNCGTVYFESGYDAYITVTPNSGAGWAIYGDIKSTVSINGVVNLNISVINSGITSHTLFSAEHLISISINGRPNNPITMQWTNHPNIPEGSVIDIITIGGVIRYSGYETSFSPAGAVIEVYNIEYNINN